MMLCHCRGVNDRVITCAIQCGAGTLDEVAEACGAGGVCGGCRPAIAELLADHGVDLTRTAARTA